jgi:D-alanyl-D-alanine carboxypeptidase
MLTACSSSDRTTASSSDAPSSSTSAEVPDERQALLDAWAQDGRGGAAVAIAGPGEPVEVLSAGVDGPDGRPLAPDAAFRVGSLTKTFMAVLVLQLVAEGAVALDDLVTAHAPDLTVADGVTVRHLLSHRSGLPEYTNDALEDAVPSDPGRTWSAGEVLDLVAGQARYFAPGEHFEYSNTNYIVAGLLLERLAGRPLADQLRERIVEPLGLAATYLPPEAARQPIGGFSDALPGGDTAGASYRAIETAAGAAGGVVSSAPDLATFVQALGSGELLPADVYAEMVRGLPAEGESLGVFPSDPPSPTGFSNDGAIPGFTSFFQHDPATGALLVLLLNDDTRSPKALATALLDTIT